jgi:hypothetical protein
MPVQQGGEKPRWLSVLFLDLSGFAALARLVAPPSLTALQPSNDFVINTVHG